MTSDEKVKWVRDYIYEQEKLNGLGVVSYSLAPVTQEVGNGLDDFAAFFGDTNNIRPTEKKSVVVITTEEQVDILKRLEKQQLIKITELNEASAFLEVVPLHSAPIKLKTMEHIARKLADVFTGSQIVDTLLDYGIPRADIPYPNTKWCTLRDLFVFLATSPDPEQREKFGGAITTFLHPLNFGADEKVSHNLIEDFNKYLKYDGYEITVADDGDGYQLASTHEKTKVAPPVKVPTESEQRAERVAKATPAPSQRVPAPVVELEPPYTPAEQEQMYSEQVEYETGILRQPKVAENLAVVREAYKTLMAITSSFCADPTEPSRELNTTYSELSKVVTNELNDYCGDTSEFEVFSFDEYKKNNFGIPFGSLYSAELDFKKKGRQLHWDEIRPEMNALLGQLEELCETANAPAVISDPKVQEVIGNAMLSLSKIAAKRKGADAADKQPTMKMEITKMPDLRLKSDLKTTGLYITKKDDDFWYKGRRLNLSKNTDYYHAFAALYAKLPEGGEISYSDLGTEIESRVFKARGKSTDEMRKFIQRNLTDRSNGFTRYASIPETEDNGKPLIEVVRSTGVVFNNQAG